MQYNDSNSFLASTLGKTAMQLRDAVAETATETAAEQVLVGVEKLSDGTRQAADAATTLHGGTTTLAQASSQLSGGLTELNDGTAQLAGKAPELADGAARLADGTAQLAAKAPSSLTERRNSLRAPLCSRRSSNWRRGRASTARRLHAAERRLGGARHRHRCNRTACRREPRYDTRAARLRAAVEGHVAAGDRGGRDHAARQSRRGAAARCSSWPTACRSPRRERRISRPGAHRPPPARHR